MVDVLQEWGYTPDVATLGRRPRRARSPSPTARSSTSPATNPAVVCGIHRGLIAGSLEQLGETGARGQPRALRRVRRRAVAHITTTTTVPHPTASKEPA